MQIGTQHRKTFFGALIFPFLRLSFRRTLRVQPCCVMKRIRLPAVGAATWGLLLALAVGPVAFAETTPFRVERTIEPRFPPGLLAESVIRGEAWVMVSVGADGKLTDALPTKYTHRALANEALYAVRAWRYQAARQDGQPIATRAELYFKFEASGAVVSMDPRTTVISLVPFAEKPVYFTALCRPADLDQPPTAVRTVSPVRPPRARDHAAGNQPTVIDFIIDENGQPRMPVLVSSPGPEYSDEAARALAQWQFTPPMRNGRPVAVQARQEFLFPDRS